MGAIVSAVKSLIVPAIVALLLFLLCTYVLVPLWQRYQSRYSHYIPLDSLSDRTSSLRQRFQARLAQYLNPSTWRRDRDRAAVGLAEDGSDTGYDSEEGEELGDVVRSADRRTELASRGGRPDDATRLSRDLEQGFIDDSSSESSGR